MIGIARARSEERGAKTAPALKAGMEEGLEEGLDDGEGRRIRGVEWTGTGVGGT